MTATVAETPSAPPSEIKHRTKWKWRRERKRKGKKSKSKVRNLYVTKALLSKLYECIQEMKGWTSAGRRKREEGKEVGMEKASKGAKYKRLK